jgi:two-component system, LytTR family, response regulator
MKKSSTHPRLSISTWEGILYVDTKEIIRLEADSNYTQFILTNDKKVISSKTLKTYEELLSVHDFFRIHKSHIINLNLVLKYTKGGGGTVTMIDNSTVKVSKYKKNELLNLLRKPLLSIPSTKSTLH